MANFSLRQFQAEIRRRGLAKPNRFEVEINVPPALLSSQLSANDTRIISMFCETANLPTRNIGVRQQKIYGPAYQRPYNTEYGGEGISLGFLLDTKMDVKAFFDRWMNKIVNPLEYYVNYPDTYATKILIHQLDSKNNRTYSVILEDAFPRNIALLDLNQSTQNQFHRLNVTFVYRKWTPVHRILDTIEQTTLSSPISALQATNSTVPVPGGIPQTSTVWGPVDESTPLP